MKIVAVLFVSFCMINDTFPMKGAEKPSHHGARVNDIKKLKPSDSGQGSGRRPSISEDVASANKVVLTQYMAEISKTIMESHDLSAQAAEDRHKDIHGLLLTTIQQFGSFEKKFDELSKRVDEMSKQLEKVEERLIESSGENLVWPLVLDLGQKSSRFNFANGNGKIDGQNE